MSSPSKKNMAQAQEIIYRIFKNPPAGPQDYKRQIRGVNPKAGRKVLQLLISGKNIEKMPSDLFMMMADDFDLASEPDPLLELLKSPEVGPAAMTMATFILSQGNLEALEDSDLVFDIPMLEKLATGSQDMLVGSILEEPDLAEEISLLFENTDPEILPSMMENLERGRLENMIPAWVFYRHCLEEEELIPHHDFMIEAISREMALTEIDLWDDLLKLLLLPASTETKIQTAMMKDRTAGLSGQNLGHDTSKAPAKTRAVISLCDGSSARVLLVVAELPNGRINIYNICLRTSGELRNGFILSNRETQEFDEMMDIFKLEENLSFTRLPLKRAIELGHQALNSSVDDPFGSLEGEQFAASCLIWAAEMGTETPGEAALNAVEYPSLSDKKNQTPPEDSAVVSEYENWFLDPVDFVGLGLAYAAPEDLSDAQATAWLDGQIELANTPEIRQRFREMLEFSAWFHMWDGNAKEARRNARAAILLKKEATAKSTIAGLLVKSFLIMNQELMLDGESPILGFGDTERRRILRELGFTRLKYPKGKHMAYLDFAEAAWSALDTINFHASPADRIANDKLPAVALVIGKAYVEGILEKFDDYDLPYNLKGYNRMTKAVMKRAGVKLAVAIDLWDAVVPAMDNFEMSICSECPEYCLDRMTTDFKGWFYSLRHPGWNEE